MNAVDLKQIVDAAGVDTFGGTDPKDALFRLYLLRTFVGMYREIEAISYHFRHVSQSIEIKKEGNQHKLTVDDQIKGLKSALKSKKTPPQLKPGLRNRLDSLCR